MITQTASAIVPLGQIAVGALQVRISRKIFTCNAESRARDVAALAVPEVLVPPC